MENKPNRTTLTENDWREIYHALCSKIAGIDTGYYGQTTDTRIIRWREYLCSIMNKIMPGSVE